MSKFIDAKNNQFLKTIDFFKKEISSIRTGRSNPNILEGIHAEAYGVNTPLNGLANISVQDGHSLIVAPWDKNIIKDIEKAIVAADLGLGVINEGDKIRLSVPKMTEENRKELVKKVNEKMEVARVSIRQVRDEIKHDIEEAEENKEINEDDKFRFIKELDEVVRNKNIELEEIREKKESDIMTV
jgi:ribosome recycling factor